MEVSREKDFLILSGGVLLLSSTKYSVPWLIWYLVIRLNSFALLLWILD